MMSFRLVQLILVMVVAGVRGSFAEDLKPAPESPELAAARDHVKLIKVAAADEKSVERVEKPLLLYGDAARANDRGSLWAWGKTGRPVALLELFRASGDEQLWIHGFTRAGSVDFNVRLPNGVVWTPKKCDLTFQPLPEMPAPANNAVGRLRQMKDASRRFEAHEFWDPNNSRFELRLLVQPVHRYDDAALGVIDGAVFVFAHGTNPEATLFIEAVKGRDGPTWQFASGRSCQAEYHVLLDGKDVVQGPRLQDYVGTSESVWLGATKDSGNTP